MNYRYRHGPAQGKKPGSGHSITHGHIPRVELAGPLGWCQLHRDKDVPATREAVWRNPTTGKRYNVVVCAKCMKSPNVKETS